jgi:hypothetical protein
VSFLIPPNAITVPVVVLCCLDLDTQTICRV